MRVFQLPGGFRLLVGRDHEERDGSATRRPTRSATPAIRLFAGTISAAWNDVPPSSLRGARIGSSPMRGPSVA